MTLERAKPRAPYRYRDKAPREPKSAPQLLQPGTRLCRWPGRDLLTGARVTPDADVRAVAEEEWYGPRTTRESQAEYGPVLGVGIARELKDWPARRAAIADDADDADDADEMGEAGE